MIRYFLAICMLLAGVIATVAQISPFPTVQGKVYKFEKVAEGVYYASGGIGGNHPIVVGDRDVVLVDTGTTPATARDLLADLKLITDKPVRTVVNTHWHYDHTFGNSIFSPDVQIIATEYLRQAMLTFDVLHGEPYLTSQANRLRTLLASLPQQIVSEQDATKKADLQKQLSDAQSLAEQLKEVRVTPPNVTYASKMTLYQGAREIDLLFLGRGHTGGDTVVYLPREKIVCTGDLMETQIAYMGDSFPKEWVATLEAIKKLDFMLALPGHGRPFPDKSLITAFQGYLTDLMAQVSELRKQGVPPEQAAKRVDLTKYQKEFPQIQGPGADLRGVRRMYTWMDGKAR